MPLISLHSSNKGADQPVHPHILVGAFNIRYLESCSMQDFIILASLCSGQVRSENPYRFSGVETHVLYDFLVTVKAAPHENVIRTDQP